MSIHPYFWRLPRTNLWTLVDELRAQAHQSAIMQEVDTLRLAFWCQANPDSECHPDLHLTETASRERVQQFINSASHQVHLQVFDDPHDAGQVILHQNLSHDALDDLCESQPRLQLTRIGASDDPETILDESVVEDDAAVAHVEKLLAAGHFFDVAVVDGAWLQKAIYTPLSAQEAQQLIENRKQRERQSPCGLIKTVARHMYQLETEVMHKAQHCIESLQENIEDVDGARREACQHMLNEITEARSHVSDQPPAVPDFLEEAGPDRWDEPLTDEEFEAWKAWQHETMHVGQAWQALSAEADLVRSMMAGLDIMETYTVEEA